MSKGVFHGIAHMFFTGLHRSKQRNKAAQSAGPTFPQHFPTQASPHHIKLDPIYYGGFLTFIQIAHAHAVWLELPFIHFHFFYFSIFFLPASSNTGTGNEQNSSNASSEPYAENVRGQVFTVGPRYTSLQYIGEGAYGMVV